MIALVAMAGCTRLGAKPGGSESDASAALGSAIRVASLAAAPSAPAVGQPVTVVANLVASGPTTVDALTIAVRDSDGNDFDFDSQMGYSVGTASQALTLSRSFPHPGAYTYFVAYEQNGAWTNLAPEQTLTVGPADDGDGGMAPPSNPGGAIVPNGPSGAWTLVFDDEFDGTAVDASKWADHSSAESDEGHGNPNNQQLEWNQGANCTVAGGFLTMTAKRESYQSPSNTYAWTSCLLTTTPSFAFQYGYIEERSQLPTLTGFWPAFWTWQADGVNSWVETDVYEYYSVPHGALYLTQHSGAMGEFKYQPLFDPSSGFHTYGADIEPGGTDFYIDGIDVFHTPATSTGMTNIITNLAVYAGTGASPAGTTTTEKKVVDYIRAFSH